MQHCRRFLVPPLLLGALLIASCGGDDDSPSTASASSGATASPSVASPSASASPVHSATGTATASSSATTPAVSPAADPSASPSASPTTPATASSTADAGSAFRDLTEDRGAEDVAVSYNLKTARDGETRTGTWRTVQDPPKSLVFFAFDGSNGGKFWIIDDGESSTICFETDDEPGQCLKTGDSSLADSLVPSVVDVDETFEKADDAPDLREVAGQTIAGRSARCFEFDDPESSEVGTICLDSGDGTLLLLKGDSVEMIATEVSSSIPNDAFEPPFTVRDLGR